MAIETCFHLSTFASTATPNPTRAGCLHQHPIAHKEKLNVLAGRGSKRAISLFSTSTSSAFKSLSSNCRANRIVCEAKNAVDQVAAVDEAGWDNLVVGNATPAVVYFWAPWCGPCRMIAPVMDELAREYVGKIVCYKVNTDNCPNISTKYGIRSIPTVLFFKNGERKESVIGAVPKSQLSDIIEKYV